MNDIFRQWNISFLLFSPVCLSQSIFHRKAFKKDTYSPPANIIPHVLNAQSPPKSKICLQVELIFLEWNWCLHSTWTFIPRLRVIITLSTRPWIRDHRLISLPKMILNIHNYYWTVIPCKWYERSKFFSKLLCIISCIIDNNSLTRKRRYSMSLRCCPCLNVKLSVIGLG